MEFGIALPNTIPGTSGKVLLDWAARAEERGFSSLAATERLVYPGYEPLTVLAAACGVTSRIRLMTNVLIAPLRSGALLAKTAAGLDQMCGGRLVLGLAPGVREDDFVAVQRDFGTRTTRFDHDLELMHRVWRGDPLDGCDLPVAPPPVAGTAIPLLLGGISAAAARRVARWGMGWTAPGLSPQQTLAGAERVRREWQAAGRSGQPRVVMLLRFMLGSDVAEAARGFVRDYFAVLGAQAAEEFVASTPSDAKAIAESVRVFADCGVDEVVFHPTVADPSQVDRLADVLSSSM